jgi:hypothetical protein
LHVSLIHDPRHSLTYQVHHADIGYSAQRNYSHRLAAALALVVRNHANPCPDYTFNVPESISKACQELLEAFKCVGDQETVGEEDELPPTLEQNLEDEEFAEHNDQDDSDAPLHLPADSTYSTPYGGAETRNPPHFCPIIQPKLHNLLVQLYTQVPGSVSSGPFFNPLIRYLVLSSIEKQGKWSSSSAITQRIAALLFTGRLTLYSLMEEQLIKNGSVQYHA